MVDLDTLHITRTTRVPVDPQVAYGMVADLGRMGEWSPVCKVCTWDDGVTSAAVGSWFTGKNVAGDREWETRCEVVAATPGEELAWIVGGADEGSTRWGYRFNAVDGGTEIEESWRIVRVSERLGQMTDEQVQSLRERTESSIATTLANIASAAGGAG